jgi:hypothetical protein
MEATTQEMAATDTTATSRIERPQGRKTGQFGMPNWTIWFPKKQLQFLGGTQEKIGLESESLTNCEVTPDARKIQRRPQQSRARFQKQS